MDLKAMTDAELDALQLAVNTEIGMRMQRERMTQRLTKVIEDATDYGISTADIDGVVSEAFVGATGKMRPKPIQASGLSAKSNAPVSDSAGGTLNVPTRKRVS
jgi:hypothetical protein